MNKTLFTRISALILGVLIVTIPAIATTPIINFSNDVLAGPVQSDTITIDVTDTDTDILTADWGYSSDGVCDEVGETIATPFDTTTAASATVTIVENTETNNGDFICAKVTHSSADPSPSYQVSANDINIDITAPTVVISSSESSPTNNNPIPMTAQFSEVVTGFLVGDISIGNGSAGNFVALDGDTYTFDVTPSGQGAVTADIAGSVAQDTALNNNAAATQFSITYDSVAPITSEVTPVPTPDNDSTPDYTYTSDEAGTTSYGGDCSSADTTTSVGSNTITFNSLGDGAHSNCTITVTDAAGNGSITLNVTAFTIETVQPTVTLTSTSSPGPTNDNPIPMTAQFSEVVTGFLVGDISVGNGTAGTFVAVDGDTYTFDVTPSGQGAVTVDVAGAVAQDAATNNNTAATQFSITFDSVAPTYSSIAAVSNNADTTLAKAGDIITFTVTLGSADSSDSSSIGFSIGGTSGLTANITDGGSSTTHTATYTVLGGQNGAVSIDSLTFTDAAGNSITGFSGPVTPSPNVTVDTTAPVTSETTPVPTPDNDATPDYTFTTDEAGDITYGGSCDSATTTASIGANPITFDALIDGTYTDCTVTVTDATGNASLTLDVSDFTIETVQPTVVLSSTETNPTNNTPIPMTAQFSEVVTGFLVGDIVVGNGTAGTFVAVDGDTYTFDVTPTLDGLVTVDVAGAVAQDAATNDNTAATQFTITYDTVAPIVSEVTPVPTPDNDPTPDYTYTSDEAGTTSYGGDCSSADTTTSAGSNTITFNSLIDGSHSNCTITVTDAAGNASIALNVTAFTIETVQPTVTLTSISSPGPTNDNPIEMTAQFSEVVTGFLVGDISVGNGTAGTFVAVDGDTYTFEVIPTLDGTVTVDVAGAVAQDAATNDNTAATQFTIVYDSTSPAYSSIAAVSDNATSTLAKAGDIITFTVTLGATDTSDSSSIGFSIGGTSGLSATISDGGPSLTHTATYTVLGGQNGVISIDSLTFTDAVGNSITGFVGPQAPVPNVTVDNTAPTVTQTTPVTTPTTDTTPDYTYNTTEAGTTSYGGDCSSADTTASSGNNTITFNSLAEGTHSNCTIAVTDATGNLSTSLSVDAFNIDTSIPTFTLDLDTEVGPVNSDLVQVTVIDANPLNLHYGISADATCDGTDTYPTSANSGFPVTITDPSDNGDFVCFRATDALGQIGYIGATNAINIDNVAPTLNLIQDAEVGPVASDTLEATFSDASAVSGFYGFSPDAVCNGSDTIGTSYVSGDPLVISSDANTGDYLCFRATDVATNSTYVGTSIPLNIDSTDPAISFLDDVEVGPVASDTVVVDIVDVNTVDLFYGFSADAVCDGGDTVATPYLPGNDPVFNTETNNGDYVCMRAVDVVGNESYDISANTLNIDITDPIVTETTPVPTPDNDTTPDYSFTTDEAGTIGYGGDCSSADTSASSGLNTVTFNALSEATHSNCTITVTDSVGNISLPLSVSSFTIDITAPTVVLSSTSLDPTNDNPIEMTAEFDEDVTGLLVGDISVGNGSAGNFNAVDGDTYTFDVTPAGDGLVTVDIAGSAAQDAAGNNNTAATQFTITYDAAAPTVVLSSTSTDPTNDNPIQITAEFSEDVVGFISGDITVSNGTKSNFVAVDGDTYTVDITPTGQGVVTVDVAGSVAQDGVGNNNTAATQFTITYDSVSPTVVLTSTSSPSPTNDNPIPMTAEFDEDVTGLLVGDISVGNGSAGNFSAVDGDTYTFDVTPSGDGLVTVDIAGSAAQDAAGNNNAAATQFTITYDTTGPTVVITSSSTDPTNDTSMTITFQFNEVVTGFALGEYTIGNAVEGSGSFLAVDGDTYTVDIAPITDGNVTVDVAGSVAQDGLGNNNSAATQFVIEYDSIAPITSEVTPVPTPDNDTTPDYTFTTDEAGTISYGGDCSSADTTATVGSNTLTFNALTGGAHSNCTIIVTDPAGNLATTLNVTAFTIDVTDPTVVLSTPAASSTNAPFTVTATFNETVTGITLGDFALTNGTGSAFTGSTNIYTILVTPTADGAVTINMAASAGQDASGNNSTVATQLSRTYDATLPVLAQVTPVTTPGTDQTPNYTFSSTEVGTIAYGGDCASADTSAAIGSNVLTFNTLSTGAHSNCTITVTDAAGNISSTLSVTAFTISSSGGGGGGSGGSGGGGNGASSTNSEVENPVISSFDDSTSTGASDEEEDEDEDDEEINSLDDFLDFAEDDEADSDDDSGPNLGGSDIGDGDFDDTKNHFSKNYVTALAQLGAISTTNEEFRPEDDITRAEFLKILMLAYGIDYSDAENTGVFLDLKEGDWKTSVVYKAFEMGITGGYDDGTFRPDKPIKRVQAIKFLMKAKGYELSETSVSVFIDVVENWMKKYTNKAKQEGIINGENTPSGPKFHPDNSMTRGEAAKVIIKSLQTKQ